MRFILKSNLTALLFGAVVGSIARIVSIAIFGDTEFTTLWTGGVALATLLTVVLVKEGAIFPRLFRFKRNNRE